MFRVTHQRTCRGKGIERENEIEGKIANRKVEGKGKKVRRRTVGIKKHERDSPTVVWHEASSEPW